ncbi:hypothetical protein AXP45_21230 [Salmonella enterica subsp. enterica]|nr:hypothetical protein [Salmonella enterica subsp. enterica]EAW1375249.1 hypothetical protein [Salmonella enterica subsp. enterica]EBQ0452881.1 hypothetical protein [Salmonella enterica subsp. enterica]EBQ0471329.1 hypothetical protein [Salmonella enterica subsp. enterica]EBQ0489144.1 hypothetical protein [Salmonella enterica subsp. enterica]
MKLYLRIVISLAIIACVYGLLIPFLISMKDTVAVISGFALALLTPPCIFVIYKGLAFTKDKE